MQYLILFLLFLVLELLYFKIADQYNIIDKPNSRSSHTAITLRGGGIIFPVAVIIAFLMGYADWSVTLAVVLVAVVSFIDDIRPLSQLPRFLSHLIAAVLIFYELNLFSDPLWLLPILLVLLIGWVNAFNFMDGINGITVLYAFSAIIGFSLLKFNQDYLPLLITMGLSCIVFGIFNIRKKAKTFAGDVGSISMALFLGYFMIKTIIESGQPAFILFFSIYGIDAGITIFTRIKKRENIFQPHRSHLYQYLANEMGLSHVLVSVIYAVLQTGLNIFLIYMDAQGNLTLLFFIGILLTLVVLYMLFRQFIVRKMVLSNS
ncbi:UDP-GlcNAc--UDP-phosphate GlcNAc-1-phosphate transferase [Flavobacterium sp. ARAG 55.4]|uniref:UDP-GlcNAc--UDP-phosphate GlcNAc-1-phosphate transferase n=1 Tax=Flavobacterium sp. ARAG 55.4 TaxID=3451357 RepID=UPI003F46DEBA